MAGGMGTTQGHAATETQLKGDYSGYHLQRFQDAETRDRKDRLRGLENLSLYAPTTSWDAWPWDLGAEHAKQGRTPNNYNFHQMYVDGQTSNLISTNTVDPKFVDDESDNDDSVPAIQSLQKVWFSDKDKGQFVKSHNASVLNGCIYRGVEEIVINRTVEEPLGRLSYNSLSPSTVIFDPSAILTDDLGLESRELWKRFYDYPMELAKRFPEHAEVLSAYHYHSSNFNQGYDRTSVPEDYWWMNKLMVVEWYNIVTESIDVAYDSEHNQILPETPYSFGSEDDFFGKFEWSRRMGFELKPDFITTYKKEIESLYCTTFCPTLSLVLQNRKDERQIYNSGRIRLPYFVWAFNQKNGKTFGTIDPVKDCQNDINKREAARTKYMTQTPFNKIIIHPLAFGEDQAKRDNFVNNLNDPSSAGILDDSAPPNMPLITTLQGINMNPALLQDEQFKMSMMDRLVSLPAAMQGITGKSGESGILHSRKVIEGNLMSRFRATRLIEYQHAKSDAWAQLAPGLYGGRTEDERFINQNRSFGSYEGESIVINEIEGIAEDGSITVIKDLSKLKRVNVIITETKQSDYTKQMNREVNIALSNTMGNETPSNIGYKAVLNAALMTGVDDLTPDRKKQIDAMADLSVDNALLTMQLQNSQLQQQLQQFTAPQQPPIPGEQQGIQAPGISGGSPAITPEQAGGLQPQSPPQQVPQGQGV